MPDVSGTDLPTFEGQALTSPFPGQGEDGVPIDLVRVDLAELPPGMVDTALAANKQADASASAGQASRRLSPWLQLVLVAGLLALVMSIAGAISRGSLPGILRQALPQLPPSNEIVGAHEGKILMVERVGDVSRVMVKRADHVPWLVISQDDVSASQPAFSPDGTAVAYVSGRDAGQIVIVPLSGTDTRAITSDAISRAASQQEKIGLCSWSPVAWSPDGKRLAFWACAGDKAFSMLLVADLTQAGPSLQVVAGSTLTTGGQRAVRWLDDTRVLTTAPAVDQAHLPSVTSFAVP